MFHTDWGSKLVEIEVSQLQKSNNYNFPDILNHIMLTQNFQNWDLNYTQK